MSQADPMTVIAELQRSRWCWRLLALSLLALVVVLFLIVALITVVGWGRARTEQIRALEAMARAEHARQEARRAEQEGIHTAGNRGDDETKATTENSVITLDVVLEEVDLAANTISATATTYVVPPQGQVGGSVFTMGTLDTPDKDKATRLVRLPVMPEANLKEKKLEAGTHAILQLGVIRRTGPHHQGPDEVPAGFAQGLRPEGILAAAPVPAWGGRAGRQSRSGENARAAEVIEAGKDFPFIVVSPQCPNNHWWEPVELAALLDEIVEKQKVDQDRICVTGLSMGGFGTWSLAVYQPKRFAALVPICGGGEPIIAKLFTPIPAWVFHGAKDFVVPLERSENMVEAMKQAGGNVKFTVYPEAGHDSWTEAYNNPDLYDWLLQQKRAK